MELREQRGGLNTSARTLDKEMERLKARIMADMGGSWSASCNIEGGSYAVTMNPSRRVSILKDDLLRLKDAHPDIFDQYATVTESRTFNVKFTAAEAAA